MDRLRERLQRLGWPVDQMTDRQIRCELYRRWFACQPPERMNEEGPLSVASARGVFVAMASEGNLDALCWSAEDPVPEGNLVEPAEQAVFVRSAESERPVREERRRSPRKPARELVYWSEDGSPWLEATGWLVDRSAHGIAFIAEASHAPEIGMQIHPSVHTRDHGVIQAGAATVVRTDPLNPELTLVCAQLDEPRAWPDGR